MWEKIIETEKKKQYYKDLELKYLDAYQNLTIYPLKEDLFNAFRLTDFQDIKVVILGQDPYHGKNQAHGLAFSTLDNKTPKSLVNIKKELLDDLGIETTSNNNLSNWANQGVLLLNTILTVEEAKPLSHKDFGWEQFTLNIFKEVCNIKSPIVFILWGNNARSYKKYISNPLHLVLESAHPSPLSSYRGFFGSKPFSKANEYLLSNNLKPIDFKI